MAKVKIGVIGIGLMGQYHTNILSSLKEAKLIGIFDIDQKRAEEVSSRYNIQAYSSYELMLRDVQAVVLASPTPTHAQIARDCLLAGKHILIEKPIAESTASANEVVELSKEKNLKCAVAMIERFNPAFQKLARLIKGQKIIGIEFKRLSPYPERIKESIVFDMMIHDIDLAAKLNPASLEEIRAYGKKKRSDSLDEVLATFYYKDGLIVKLDASRLKDYKERRIVVTTDKAIYDADLLLKKLYVRSFDDLVQKMEVEIKPEDQLTSELRSFLFSIQKDRKPEVPFEEALTILKTAEEVEKIACS